MNTETILRPIPEEENLQDIFDQYVKEHPLNEPLIHVETTKEKHDRWKREMEIRWKELKSNVNGNYCH